MKRDNSGAQDSVTTINLIEFAQGCTQGWSTLADQLHTLTTEKKIALLLKIIIPRYAYTNVQRQWRGMSGKTF